MRSMVNVKTIGLILVLSLFLPGIKDGAGQEKNEREMPLEQRKHLSERVETLRREQDFLLFQQGMYASDSKYLVISATARTGQLKYKNRVLKDFRFASSRRIGMLKPGAVTLTKKIESARERQALIFGSSLILLGKRVPPVPVEQYVPRVTLAKKDFISLFYAVEKGAKAYILP